MARSLDLGKDVASQATIEDLSDVAHGESHLQTFNRDARDASSSQYRDVTRTRSADSLSSLDWRDEDVSDGDDEESVGAEFSMEGYTIDLAMLGRTGSTNKLDGNGSSVTRKHKHHGAAVRKKRPSSTASLRAQNGSHIRNSTMQVSLGAEDDGPEDFTLNMGQWINGNGKWPKDERSEIEGIEPGEAPDDFGESLQDPLGTSTPLPLRQPQLSIGRTVDATAQPQPEVEFRSHESAMHFQQLEHENLDLRKQNADLCAQLQERAPLFSATVMGLPSSSPMGASPNAQSGHDEEQAAVIKIANERVETLESALKASHDALRQLRGQMSEAVDVQKSTIEGLREDLDGMKAQLQSKSSHIEELEQGASASGKTIAEQCQAITRMSNDAVASQTELENAQDQLRETRRILASIEEENDRFSSENARQADDLAETEQLLKTKTNELQAAHATIARLRDGDNTSDKNEKSKQRDVITLDDHSADLHTLTVRHANNLSETRSAHAAQIQRLKNDHSSEIQHLRSDLTKAETTVATKKKTETELRTAIRALSSKLDTTTSALHAAQTELAHAQQKAETAQRDATELARQENDFVNAEMERRFASAVEEREKEWRRRVEMLLREREKMSKVLLSEWGRFEEGNIIDDGGGKGRGDTAGQRYRYRYVKR